MAFAAPMMMIATAIGAGVTAYGQYQAGQAQAAQYGYQADVNRKLAAAAITNANWDVAAGGVRSQQAGYVGAATIGRETAEAGARNVAGGSPTGVVSSARAIAQENEKIQTADAAHAAYGEQFQAAEKTATAGAQTVAAGTAVTAGDIGALGSIVSGVGSVAGKWYDITSTTGPSKSTVYTG